MLLVVIESPFAASAVSSRDDHWRYLKRCLLDSLRRGEAPYASHALFPHVLDDDTPEERKLGIEAGLRWGSRAELVAVYTDHGISEGMKIGIDRHEIEGRPVVYRSIGL